MVQTVSIFDQKQHTTIGTDHVSRTVMLMLDFFPSHANATAVEE
jgi:hypothetical protein